MTDPTTTQTVLFPELFRKPVTVHFDQAHSSSDGGAILLRAADLRLSLTERLSRSVTDTRDPSRVRHTIHELLGQRVFGIACGYADCADVARLAEDPIHKLLVGRDSVDGEALGSQPTLSRLENGIGRRELYRMGEALADTVIERHRKRLVGTVDRITIDLDTTDLATFGEQQLSLFNGYYSEWCYLPLMAFVTFNDEKEQYAIAAMLRPGKGSIMQGTTGLLRRLLSRIREAFPDVRIRVRLDGGFANPEMFGFAEQEGVEYVVGMAQNEVLKREAADLMEQVRTLSETTGKTETQYGECQYSAATWEQPRRVIIKAEVVRLEGREPRDNARFVVTNLEHSAEEIYMLDYCGRGEIENRLKEMKALHIGRVSCQDFWANQLRVLLTLAAFVLMQEIRLPVTKTKLGRLMVTTLRERLFKIAARIDSSVRRLVLHLPKNSPWGPEWRQVALALGALAV